MIKLFAIALTAAVLAACGSMTTQTSSGNPAETKNSSDANKSRNPAAVSPGGGGR